jgi:hypothetical protein
MYSYKKTKENTASPIHEKFENYGSSVIAGANSNTNTNTSSSDSSDSESSSSLV